MGLIYQRIQRSALTAMILIIGTGFGVNALAFGDDAGIAPTVPSPLAAEPECKLGSGIFRIPDGQNDARNPLTVVGKVPKDMLSRLYTSDDFVSIPYQNTSPEQTAIFAPGYFETMRAPAANAVVNMIAAAQADGIALAVHSGFRAYSIQCEVFNHKMNLEFKADPKLKRGNRKDELAIITDVNTRSAIPGQSEHQLGTALDIVTNIPGMGWKLEPEMDQTPAFAWLQANAYKFGFVLSYPKGPAGPKAVNPRTGYVYEPWHWRYIGIVPAARYQACLAKNFTTTEFLRALNANPQFTCNVNTPIAKGTVAPSLPIVAAPLAPPAPKLPTPAALATMAPPIRN